MRTLSESSFLQWAVGNGFQLDPRYPKLAVLGFSVDTQARFWCMPPEPERRPFFLSCFLELMGEWQSCFVWRHSGSWPDPDHIEPQRINDVVEHRILSGLGLPGGTADVLEFARAETPTLITLLFSTSVFGWSVGEDLYVVPDHARYLLQTDHHNVIHVEFREAQDVEFWVAQMTKRGFDLPTELPDATFKHPDWMSQ
jgi:hypothetical protein